MGSSARSLHGGDVDVLLSFARFELGLEKRVVMAEDMFELAVHRVPEVVQVVVASVHDDSEVATRVEGLDWDVLKLLVQNSEGVLVNR